MDKIKFDKIITVLVALSLIDASTANARKNCNCVHIDYCPKAYHILEQSQNYSLVTLCNPRTDKMVCCPEEPKLTISEKKCEEFVKIKGYCRPEGLIMEGRDFTPHDFPFIVSVQFKNREETKHRPMCGGALIDPKWVLTAAHCFDEVFDKPDTKVFAFLGAHNKSGPGIRIKANVTIHPHYNSSDILADLALLELDREININTREIRPICLPKTNGSEYEYFRVAGWGQFDGNNYPDNLLTTELRQVEFENCEENITAIEKRICAGPKGDLGDVCPGDSGGPVFAGYPGRDSCLFALTAVVSEGKFCGSKGSYTSHTRVSYYRDWIERTVWPTEK